MDRTQRGVDVTGTGETPQWAAVDYCRKVADRVEDEEERDPAETDSQPLET